MNDHFEQLILDIFFTEAFMVGEVVEQIEPRIIIGRPLIEVKTNYHPEDLRISMKLVTTLECSKILAENMLGISAPEIETTDYSMELEASGEIVNMFFGNYLIDQMPSYQPQMVDIPGGVFLSELSDISSLKEIFENYSQQLKIVFNEQYPVIVGISSWDV